MKSIPLELIECLDSIIIEAATKANVKLEYEEGEGRPRFPLVDLETLDQPFWPSFYRVEVRGRGYRFSIFLDDGFKVIKIEK